MIETMRQVIEDRRTERVVTALILINAVTLGLETNPAVMERFGEWLYAIDRLILAVFVLEIGTRMVVQGFRFWRDPWNLFDFSVVAIALVPTTEAFSVFRALRILRVLRLITVVPSLRRVVTGFIGALPGMGSIVLLIALIYYVFAVIATKLYGADYPQLFGSIGTSLFTLFTVMTLEGWVDGVTRPVMEKFPYAWLFFITFIIVTTFMVLNLFIGVVVNAMQAEHAKEEAEEREAERALIEEETEPLVAEIKALRADVTALRTEISRRSQGAG